MSLWTRSSVLTSRKFAVRSLRPLSTALGSALQRHAPLDIHPEVQEALASNKPVVALETTLVSHGFPYPVNVELARSLENIVRSTGSIPATIGIIGGRVKVGLEQHELERLGDTRKNPSIAKISRRDIAPAIATKSDGATTCSATLIFAALAGIKVFATGGLGGVHRDGENSMDVSADLGELTRCPVGLVSSGVKSILDIGRTLEYLETLGVPVLTYGETREFPAFFSRHSGYDSPWNVNDPTTAAKILYAQWQLGMNNGALIAVPIPEEYEAIGATIQKAVDQAVVESEANGISRRGKEATPWLLSRVSELTKGVSRTSNIALLKNTALVGGQIAVEYQKLANEKGHPYVNSDISSFPDKLYAVSNFPKSQQEDTLLPPADLMIVGSAAIDVISQADLNSDSTLAIHSTAPGNVSVTLGGVARNIAEASHRVMASQSPDRPPLLVSPIGNDLFGRLMVDGTRHLGMRTDGLVKCDARTAVCNMILDSNGSLVGGVADMGITETFSGDKITPHIQKHVPRIVALDGNLSPDTIQSVVEYCVEHNTDVFFEPTSVIKSTHILPAISASLDKVGTDRAPVAFSSPNLLELAQMYQAARGEPYDLMSRPVWWEVIDNLSLGSAFRMDLEQLARKNVTEKDLTKGTLAFLVDQGVAQMAVNLLPFFQHLVVKCGDRGVLVVMRIAKQDSLTSNWKHERTNPLKRLIVARGNSEELVILQHFPALPIETVVNVTGAGDSFVGALLASIVQKPKAFYDPKACSDIIGFAQRAATLSLRSHCAVSPLLSELHNL